MTAVTHTGGRPDVIVVGGGFAGLAAATALAEQDARVVVLEGRPYLGGRARSWLDPETGQVVDNGQHLFMGCYRETLRFLTRLGTREHLALQPRLAMHLIDRGGQVGTFSLPALPAPVDRLAAFLRYPGLSMTERWGLTRVARAVRREARRCAAGGDTDPVLERSTVAGWLDHLGQTEEAKRRLWYPVSISALNELPNRASAAMLAPVLREAFLGGADDARLGVPSVGLSDLYAEPSAHYLRQRHCTIRLRSPVRRVVIENRRCAGVVLGTGERVNAGAVVLAAAHSDLLDLLPPVAAADPGFAGVPALEWSPILSVYLWFGGPVFDLPFAALVDGTWHWIFDRRGIGGREGGAQGVTLVCSAARHLVDRSIESLVRSALDDLHAFVPESRRATLRRSLVIKEKRATFSPACGTSALRPPPQTPYDGLYLAGDWTATGLPATIEGAVQSGHACARLAARGAVS
jgi:squalene-associated FAD-dependent desaturase